MTDEPEGLAKAALERLALRLQNGSAAGRLQPAEVHHILQVLQTLGATLPELPPEPEEAAAPTETNAEVEGAEAPAADEEDYEYDDTDEDDDDEEVTAPKRRTTKRKK